MIDYRGPFCHITATDVFRSGFLISYGDRVFNIKIFLSEKKPKTWIFEPGLEHKPFLPQCFINAETYL